MNDEDPLELLKQLGRGARKRLGQHFLSRKDVCDAMVRAARVTQADHVFEVGPGLGILTGVLLESGCSLTSIELDDDLAAFIERTRPGVKLLHADAAKANWLELCGGVLHKVVANLPYNVGTGLVMDWLRTPAPITSITVMLQAEVVARMLSEAGNRTYGALSVQVQARGEARYVLPVPASSFVPPPKVASAVIHIERFVAPRVGTVSPKFFDKVVRSAFSQRRKVIRNALSPIFGRDPSMQALEMADIDSGLRAEAVDLDGYRRLAAALYATMQPES